MVPIYAARLSRGDGQTSDSIDLDNTDQYIILAGTMDLSVRGVITFDMLVKGVDANHRVRLIQDVQRKLNEAASFADGGPGVGVTFGLQRGSNELAMFDLTGGTITSPQFRPDATTEQVSVELRCLPYPRSAPWYWGTTGTLAGGNAAFLVRGVPGMMDALVRAEITDLSGALNRVRWASVPAQGLSLSDYDPWLSVVGTYTGTSMTPQTLATATLPSGELYHGVFDVYARYRSQGAAIAAPTSPAVTVTAPESTITQTTAIEDITVGASGKGRTANPSDPLTATWSAPTNAGSMLLMVVVAQSAETLVTPSGWTLLRKNTRSNDPSNTVMLNVYWKRNAASESGTVNLGLVYNSITGTPSTEDPWTMFLLELRGADIVMNTNVLDSGVLTNEPSHQMNDRTWFARENIFAVFALAGNGIPNWTDFWYNGYLPISAVSGNNIVAGRVVIDSPVSDSANLPTAKVRLIASFPTWNGVLLSIKPKTTTTSTTVYAETTPGELKARTYPSRVRAIDAANGISNAIAFSAPVITTDRSSLTYTWVASTNAVQYELVISDGTHVYSFITSGTSLTITTLANGTQVAALPATTGAAGVAPRMEAIVGTSGDLTFNSCPEIVLDTDNVWRMARVAGGRQIPPLGAALDWSRLSGAVRLRGRSSNGAPATVEVSHIWMAHHGGSRATFENPTMESTTARRWVVESHRSGRGAIGWMENIAAGDAVRILRTAGVPLLSPGDNIITLLLEGVNGAVTSLSGISVSVRLIIYPRWLWEAMTL